jgi:hypothetical protein
MKKLSIILCVAAIFLFLGCKKNSGNPTSAGGNIDSSPAAKIAGMFSGIGKYLPANINLGNTLICTTPTKDYNTFYQTGVATINVIKLTDTTVKIQFLSGPFPIDSYSLIKVTQSGNIVEFLQGSYDINSNAILFSGVAPGYAYSYSANCKIGLPFYTSTIGPGTSGFMEYFNFTIKRYEFGGTKQ